MHTSVYILVYKCTHLQFAYKCKIYHNMNNIKGVFVNFHMMKVKDSWNSYAVVSISGGPQHRAHHVVSLIRGTHTKVTLLSGNPKH